MKDKEKKIPFDASDQYAQITGLELTMEQLFPEPVKPTNGTKPAKPTRRYIPQERKQDHGKQG